MLSLFPIFLKILHYHYFQEKGGKKKGKKRGWWITCCSALFKFTGIRPLFVPPANLTHIAFVNEQLGSLPLFIFIYLRIIELTNSSLVPPPLINLYPVHFICIKSGLLSCRWTLQIKSLRGLGLKVIFQKMKKKTSITEKREYIKVNH